MADQPTKTYPQLGSRGIVEGADLLAFYPSGGPLLRDPVDSLVTYLAAGGGLLKVDGTNVAMTSDQAGAFRGEIGADFYWTPEQFQETGFNDYQAIQAMVVVVNSIGGNVKFLPRTYTLPTPKISSPDNGIRDIVFTASGFTIDMDGAKILCPGGFTRPNDLSQFPYSTVNSVTPFVMQGNNWRIVNGEINGNNTTITDASGAGEGSSFGIRVDQACTGWVIENVNLHNCACDNIYLGTPFPFTPATPAVNQRGLIINCRLQYASRSNMSIAGSRDILIMGNYFGYAGYESIGSGGIGVIGAGPAYAPGNGIDIEPEMPDVTSQTTNIRIIGNTFEQNRGHDTDTYKIQLNMAGGVDIGANSGIGNVTVSDNTFTMHSIPGALVSSAFASVIQGNMLENVALSLLLGGSGDESVVRGNILGNIIKSTIPNFTAIGGVIGSGTKGPVFNISANQIFIEPVTAYTDATRVIDIEGWPSVNLSGNQIFVSATAFEAEASTPTRFYVATIGCKSVGNRWRSDYAVSGNLMVLEYQTSLGCEISDVFEGGHFSYEVDETTGNSGAVPGSLCGTISTWTPGTFDPGVVHETDVTVLGAKLGMILIPTLAQDQRGVDFYAYVKSSHLAHVVGNYPSGFPSGGIGLGTPVVTVRAR